MSVARRLIEGNLRRQKGNVDGSAIGHGETYRAIIGEGHRRRTDRNGRRLKIRFAADHEPSKLRSSERKQIWPHVLDSGQLSPWTILIARLIDAKAAFIITGDFLVAVAQGNRRSVPFRTGCLKMPCDIARTRVAAHRLRGYVLDNAGRMMNRRS